MDDLTDSARSTLHRLWADLAGEPRLADEVAIAGPTGVLPSVFDVTGFATAAVGTAALAVAELAGARRGGPTPAVAVDRLGASAAFRAEALLTAVGWELPPIWDPIAGDHQAADGWVRLHTNYRHHLTAVLEVLHVPAEREAVAAAVATWKAEELEAAVVAAGGCAAAMRSEEAWEAHPAGEATRSERPAVLLAGAPSGSGAGRAGALEGLAPSAPPLAGVRVLDLTRVIAGPLATRYLAGYGAEVLRVDPPGFEEVGALLPETTAGKRCAALDLRTTAGRERFLELVAEAHVVVDGLRPSALAELDLGADQLRAANPALIVVHHDAYGWAGPWRGRRGFDSLVQMSTGIAAAGAAAAGLDRPAPLPAQALDHGLAHLLAAGACRALTRLVRDGEVGEVRGSLVGAANVVRSSPACEPSDPGVTVADAPRVAGTTTWGEVQRVPLAGRVDTMTPSWDVDAGPLGRHPARFGPG